MAHAGMYFIDAARLGATVDGMQFHPTICVAWLYKFMVFTENCDLVQNVCRLRNK